MLLSHGCDPLGRLGENYAHAKGWHTSAGFRWQGGAARLPSGLFKLGRVAAGLGPAHAKIGDKRPIAWNIKVLGQSAGCRSSTPTDWPRTLIFQAIGR